MIKIPQNIKALIFDCDGTLADTMALHLDAWQKAFETNGRTFPRDFIDSLKGAPGPEIIRLYNEKFKDNLNLEKIANEKAEFTKESIKFTKPIQPVVDIAIKYKNLLPMSVASGGSKYNVHSSLTSIGILNLFDFVLTSNDQIPAKPNPDIFLECARRMNVAPEDCLVFEDGDFGLEAADKAGMSSVDVRKYL